MSATELTSERPLEPASSASVAIFDGTLEALVDLSGVLAFTVLLAVGAGAERVFRLPHFRWLQHLRRIVQWHLRELRFLLLPDDIVVPADRPSVGPPAPAGRAPLARPATWLARLDTCDRHGLLRRAPSASATASWDPTTQTPSRPGAPRRKGGLSRGAGAPLPTRLQPAAHTAATAPAMRIPCSRPARAAAARRPGSSTFEPIARRAAASGLTASDRTPEPSDASCQPTRPARRRAAVTGASTTTRSQPVARSALASERTPPSTYRRPLIVTGGKTSGTAQLAATASRSATPPPRSNTVASPLAASTAVIRNRRSGQARLDRPCSKRARHSDSGIVRAASAARPRRARPRSGWRVEREASSRRRITVRPIRSAFSPVASASCPS